MESADGRALIWAVAPESRARINPVIAAVDGDAGLPRTHRGRSRTPTWPVVQAVVARVPPDDEDRVHGCSGERQITLPARYAKPRDEEVRYSSNEK